MSIEKNLRDVAFLMVKQAQEIIRLNGAYKTGKLYNSFKINVKQNPAGWLIEIENEAKHAFFIDKGTMQWKNQKQEKSPVTRKYSAVPPQNYPDVMGGYPFNKKGIEPIYFMESIKNDLPTLTEALTSAFTKQLQQDIINTFKEELINKK